MAERILHKKFHKFIFSKDSHFFSATILCKLFTMASPCCKRSTRTYCDIFLLAEEAHSNVVPERGTFRRLVGCYSVLGESHIKVAMLLHHAAHCKDGLHIRRVIGHSIAKVVKCLLELANLRLRQSQRQRRRIEIEKH